MINWPLVRKKSATAPDDPAATGVASYSESTEYGAPRKPATADDSYGWLGSKQRSTNDLAGLTDMGMRLYNPATGRFLSVDPVAGGNANPYTYPVDPIDRFDLNGACGWCHRLWNDVKAVAHQINIAVLGPSIPGTMTVGKLAAYIKHHFKGFSVRRNCRMYVRHRRGVPIHRHGRR